MVHKARVRINYSIHTPNLKGSQRVETITLHSILHMKHKVTQSTIAWHPSVGGVLNIKAIYRGCQAAYACHSKTNNKQTLDLCRHRIVHEDVAHKKYILEW